MLENNLEKQKKRLRNDLGFCGRVLEQLAIWLGVLALDAFRDRDRSPGGATPLYIYIYIYIYGYQ